AKDATTMERSNALSQWPRALRAFPTAAALRMFPTAAALRMFLTAAALAAASVALAPARVDAQPRAEVARPADSPSPPAQPASGFGGRDYAYSSLEHETHGSG